jgi:hypothetical protein
MFTVRRSTQEHPDSGQMKDLRLGKSHIATQTTRTVVGTVLHLADRDQPMQNKHACSDEGPEHIHR